MIRKTVVTVCTVAVAFAGVVASATPARAAKAPLGDASGEVNCEITGGLKFDPPLSDINTQPSTMTGKFKSTGCSSLFGTIGAHPITKLRGRISSVHSPGTCQSLLEPGSPVTIQATWRATGASLNATTITYVDHGPAEGAAFTFPSQGPLGAATSTVTGSFGGLKSYTELRVDVTQLLRGLADTGPTATGQGCGAKNGKAKGIKKLTFFGGNVRVFS